jgi:hypothetical protein
MSRSLFICGVGNGDVLDIVVHQNTRVSDAIVSNILGSGNLPIVYSTYGIIAKFEIFQNLLKNSQIGNGFKALPLN